MTKNSLCKLMVILLTAGFSILSFGQELKVKSFKKLENNTSARIYKETDINGQSCAIIILKHNFKNYIVETGKDYEKLEEKVGETWIWVSPDEYRIIIRKQGYLPLEHNIKNKIKSLETYELVVTDGYGQIIAQSEKSEFFLDGKKVGNDSIYLPLKEGRYTLKVTREKYYPEEKYIILKAGELVEYDIKLKPIVGDLVLKGDLNKVTVLINGQPDTIKNGTIELFCGQHNLIVQKESFIDFERQIDIVKGENIVHLTMTKDPCYWPKFETSFFYSYGFNVEGDYDMSTSHFNVVLIRNYILPRNNCFPFKMMYYAGFFTGSRELKNEYEGYYIGVEDETKKHSGFNVGLGFGMRYFQMGFGGGFSKGNNFFDVFYKIDLSKRLSIKINTQMYQKQSAAQQKSTALLLGLGFTL